MPSPDIGNNYSGKLLFSMLLPSTLNLEYRSLLCRDCEKCVGSKCPYDAYVKIKRGKLVSGVIDKVSLQGILLDTIFRQYGPEEAKEFLNKSTRLLLASTMHQGFSVSVEDTRISKEAQQEIKAIIADARQEVNRIIKDYNEGRLKKLPGKTLRETMEDMIMAILGKARKDAGDVAANYLSDYNPIIIMSRVGARGSLLNVTQMSAMVGQQAVRGKRIMRGYRNKSLPYFKEGEMGIEARGFVSSSFMEGLTPTEYFFHAMGGREALVDKGIRTAKSGYMQRRLVNALQDIVARKDGTVRDSDDVIVQYKYGEDGTDPMKCHGDYAVRLETKTYVEEKDRDEINIEDEGDDYD